VNKTLKYLLVVSPLVLAGYWVFFWVAEPAEKSVKNLLVGDREIQAEIADNVVERAQGLSGRESMCETCGMLFVFPQAQVQNFWMRDMRFPLDIIFIRDDRITEIFADVPVPSNGEIPRVESRESADQVLELNAGVSGKLGIRVGDEIDLVDTIYP